MPDPRADGHVLCTRSAEAPWKPWECIEEQTGRRGPGGHIEGLRQEKIREALSFAVPLWIAEMADWPPYQRDTFRANVDLIAGQADLLLAPLPTSAAERWKRHQVFTAIAKGIARMAYAPGGVRIFGLHWCTDHDVCLAAERGAAEEGDA